jgi:hypothetical protein
MFNQEQKDYMKLLNGFEMSSEQKESQRRSFIYGTTKLANSEITEDLVNEVGYKRCQK